MDAGASGSGAASHETVETPKRGRGRPRKDTVRVEGEASSAAQPRNTRKRNRGVNYTEDPNPDAGSDGGGEDGASSSKRPTRGRGRPPKLVKGLPQFNRSRRRDVSTELMRLASDELGQIPRKGVH